MNILINNCRQPIVASAGSLALSFWLLFPHSSFCVETMWNTKNQGKGVFLNVMFSASPNLGFFFQNRYSIDPKTNNKHNCFNICCFKI